MILKKILLLRIKKSKQKKIPWKLSKIINIENFRVKLFINHLVENLSLNTTYSLLIKVGYSDNSFYMAGKQIGIVVKHFHNIKYYENIYGIIVNKIEELETSDPKKGKPDTIYMLLKELIPLPGLELTSIKPKELNKKS